MSKVKPLFSTCSKNVANLLADEKEISVEASFARDFDFTMRQLNKKEPRYYFKEITSKSNPEYFNTENSAVNVVVLDKLPEQCTAEHVYETNHLIYHTNDQKYYIGKYYDGKPTRRYKPSSMNCLRSMYYQIIGADLDKQQQKSGDFFGICESGTDRHKRIQYAITQMQNYGVDCEYIDVASYIEEKGIQNLVIEGQEEFETKVYDKDRNIIFLCDGLLRYNGELYILEIKTESSYKWLDRSYVDDKHRNQAYTYSLELGVDKVLFFYENRDVCTKKPYVLTVTDDDRKYIEKRVSDCDDYVSKHVVPPVEEHITSRICQYCDYRTVCKVDSK